MLKRMLLVAGLMVALASPALAETNGVYVGLKFLDSIQSTGSVSKSSGISSLFDVDNYTQNTVAAAFMWVMIFTRRTRCPCVRKLSTPSAPTAPPPGI